MADTKPIYRYLTPWCEDATKEALEMARDVLGYSRCATGDNERVTAIAAAILSYQSALNLKETLDRLVENMRGRG